MVEHHLLLNIAALYIGNLPEPIIPEYLPPAELVNYNSQNQGLGAGNSGSKEKIEAESFGGMNLADVQVLGNMEGEKGEIEYDSEEYDDFSDATYVMGSEDSNLDFEFFLDGDNINDTCEDFDVANNLNIKGANEMNDDSENESISSY